MLKNNVCTSLILMTAISTFIGCGNNNSNKAVDTKNQSEASVPTTETEIIAQSDPSNIANSPIDQVFKKVKDLHDFRVLDIRQEFNSPESSKNEATVILTKDGLADDSIAAERVKYNFKFIDGIWTETAKEETWRCGRGADTESFHTKRCL